MNDADSSPDEPLLTKTELEELAAKSKDPWLSEAKLGLILPIVSWLAVPTMLLLIGLFSEKPKETGPVDLKFSYGTLAAGLPPCVFGLYFSSVAILKKCRWVGSIGILLSIVTILVVLLFAWMVSQRWRLV